jgi:hypothetical protein
VVNRTGWEPIVARWFPPDSEIIQVLRRLVGTVWSSYFLEDRLAAQARKQQVEVITR